MWQHSKQQGSHLNRLLLLPSLLALPLPRHLLLLVRQLMRVMSCRITTTVPWMPPPQLLLQSLQLKVLHRQRLNSMAAATTSSRVLAKQASPSMHPQRELAPASKLKMFQDSTEQHR